MYIYGAISSDSKAHVSKRVRSHLANARKTSPALGSSGLLLHALHNGSRDLLLNSALRDQTSK